MLVKCMYPSISNRFPVIQRVSSKVRNFSTFFAGQTHSSVYPSIFNRLQAIMRYWSEIATFSYPLHLTPPLGVFPLEFRKNGWSSEN